MLSAAENVMHADSALVRRAQANDRAAFNEIVLRYKDRIFNYIYRTIRHSADAEDLTQETFVRAYQSIRSFQVRASLNTWLFRIATNLCIDYARKQKTCVPAESLSCTAGGPEQGAYRDIPDEALDPQRLLIGRELTHQVEAALAQLPEKLRTALLLYDVEGLSYEEIAAVLECPLGTVKSRIFHARAALRDRIAPYLNGIR